MTLELQLIYNDESNLPHEYKTWKFSNDDDCVNIIANKYKILRTECASKIDLVSFDGITILDTTSIKKHLESKTIPDRTKGNFDIIRADFGETIGHIILEEKFDTKYGYNLIRDRERYDMAGRGIDIVGVEQEGDILKLIITECKVSEEERDNKPPQVVDDSSDSISKKLKKSVINMDETSCLLWDVARKTQDKETADLLFAVAVYWDKKEWTKLRVICCGVLIRPSKVYTKNDYGKLKTDPTVVNPFHVRFIIVCCCGKLDDAVSKFDKLIHPLQEVKKDE